MFIGHFVPLNAHIVTLIPIKKKILIVIFFLLISIIFVKLILINFTIIVINQKRMWELLTIIYEIKVRKPLW